MEHTKHYMKQNQKEERQVRLLRLVMRFAGVFLLISAVLTFFHSKYWVLFTAFVGLNIFQYSFTKFCPLEMILKRIIK
ncbi:MAG: DUF2892 domain-containing protein [Candidatus Woesearchaeota archaeon]